MKIVIAGIGKLGEYLTKLLVKDNNEVTIIDHNFNGKEELINNEEVNYIEGSALDSNILIQAGVENSDLLISVMKSDTENIVCALIGKKLGVKNTIARVRNTEYLNSINIIKDTLGLSMLVNQDYLTASKIAMDLSVPNAIDVTSFFKGRINVVSVKVKENSVLCNLAVKDIRKKISNNIIVCAIERDGKTMIPTTNIVLQVNDIVHVIGQKKDINSFLRVSNFVSAKTKKVIIAGGSNIAIYLGQMLYDMGMNVTIIEKDIEKCNVLSEKLPNTLIINSDISQKNVLYEEGIKKCDAFIALTSVDEENIIYSMFASNLNIPKIITKVNHIDLEGIIEKTNIDNIVIPHRITANQIVQYIRAVEKSDGSSCESIYTFKDDIFLMMEFKIKNDFNGLNIKLKNLKLKDGILIGAIQRGKRIIYPNDNDEIKLNDTVLIISSENELKDLNEVIN